MTKDTQSAETQGADDTAVPAPAAASFDELMGSAKAATGASLDSLLDVTLPITIEFGRTQMTVQETLELGRGSVIQLDRVVGEPVDIYISDRKLAEGDVVVIGEAFGVRITRLLGSPTEGVTA